MGRDRRPNRVNRPAAVTVKGCGNPVPFRSRHDFRDGNDR
jgi:hypothetical protein